MASTTSGSTSVTLVATSSAGQASATVLVTDTTGHPLPGVPVQASARVSGEGQTRTVTFPATDANGRSTVTIPVSGGQGTSISWSVQLQRDGATLSVQTQTTVA